MLFLCAVPAPTVTLTHPSGPLYQGTSHSLNCTASLPPSVDTDINITTHWTAAVSSDRSTILSPSLFVSTLTISPLATSDAGQYFCAATAHSYSQYITNSGSGRSPEETLSVTGTLFHHWYTIEQWFEVCLCPVLYCVVDSNPYQPSCPGSSVGKVLTKTAECHWFVSQVKNELSWFFWVCLCFSLLKYYYFLFSLSISSPSTKCLYVLRWSSCQWPQLLPAVFSQCCRRSSGPPRYEVGVSQFY